MSEVKKYYAKAAKAPLTEEQRAARNRYQRERWARLSVEERHARNQQKYKNHKDKHRARALQWAKDNPEKTQAAVHNSTIKEKYNAAWETTDIDNAALAAWLITKKAEQAPCPYCGGVPNHIDHVIPLSRGGTHTWDNIDYICAQCNFAKRDATRAEFIDWIQKTFFYISNR